MLDGYREQLEQQGCCCTTQPAHRDGVAGASGRGRSRPRFTKVERGVTSSQYVNDPEDTWPDEEETEAAHAKEELSTRPNSPSWDYEGHWQE